MRKRVLNFYGLANDAELIDICGPKGRGVLLYEGLWSMAEDWGGYEYDPRTIANSTGHLKFTPKEVEKYIERFKEKQKIIEYFSNSGKMMHWLKNFKEHQTLKTPALPSLPLPPWITYEIGQYPKSKRKYAKYTVHTELLPEACRVDINTPLAVNVQTACSHREGIRNGHRTQDIGHDIDNKGKGADAPPSKYTDSEHQEFEAKKDNIKALCSELMTHFSVSGKYVLGKTKGFHPIGFVINAKKSSVPVSVIVQVLESMARQKEDIVNPYAWLINVMKSEHANYNYSEHVAEHEARKRDEMKPVGDALRGVMPHGS